MLKKEDYQKVGVINKPRGISGDLNFGILPQIMLNEVSFPFLFLEIEGYLVPFKTEQMYWNGDDHGIVKFEDIDSNEDASKITGCSFFIENEALQTDEDNSVIGSLVGCTMYNEKEEAIGNVTDFMDIPGNPVLVIQRNKEEFLVPFHENLVIEIDTIKKIIRYKIPEGLLD